MKNLKFHIGNFNEEKINLIHDINLLVDQKRKLSHEVIIIKQQKERSVNELKQIEVEIGQRHDGLRVSLQEFGESLRGVALHDLVLFQMRHRALLLLQLKYPLQVRFIAWGRAVVTLRNALAVFACDRDEAGERVEGDRAA